MQKVALLTSGTIFILLALSHVIRWLSPVEILINGYALSFVVSLVSGVTFTLLSIWMFVAAKKIKSPPQKD